MNKKIIFVGLVFVLFAGVFLSANSANAAFWDWFRGRSDNTAAVAKAARVALKVEKSGKGVVTSDDGKINCRKDCSEVYYSGGSVTLKAIPADGFTFEKWTGNACVSFSASTEEGASGACSVSLDYNKNKTITATAHFKKTSGSSSSKSSALPSNPPIDAGTLPTTGTCTVTDDGVTVCTDTSVGTASSAASSSKSKSSSSSATTKPTLKVISPNGGEVWRAGTTKNIVFKGNLIKEPVFLNLHWGGESGGNVFIGESITSGNGKASTYSWTIPAGTEPRNDYRVSVRYPNGNIVTAVVQDKSDKPFTIKNTTNSSSKSSSSKSSSSRSSSSKSSSSSATSTVYMLKINKSGKGNVSDGGRLNCGGVCAEKYWPGSEVKIRAVPNGGYVFKKFTPEKECSSIYSDGFGFNDNKLIKQAFAYGAAENVVCVTTMNKNKTITAVFEIIKK